MSERILSDREYMVNVKENVLAISNYKKGSQLMLTANKPIF